MNTQRSRRRRLPAKSDAGKIPIATLDTLDRARNELERVRLLLCFAYELSGPKRSNERALILECAIAALGRALDEFDPALRLR